MSLSFSLMEQADKKELTVAVAILGVYIAFILARRVCSTIPEFCGEGWIIFGVSVVGVTAFLSFKLFR